MTEPIVVERQRHVEKLRAERRRAIEDGDHGRANVLGRELWRLGVLLAEFETVDRVLPERAVVRKRRAAR
jgi:hypothetical protein